MKFMNKIQILLFFLIILLIEQKLIIAEEKLTNEEKSNLVKVEIIPQSQHVRDGDTVLVAFKFKMQKHWHIYWVNSGDSGLPTEVKLKLKNGITESNLEYPIPTKIPFSGYVNFGYENELILFKKLYFPKTSSSKFNEIHAKISWLVCKETCIPQDTNLTIKFVIANERIVNSKWVENRLDSIYSLLPKKNTTFAIKAEKGKNSVKIDLTYLYPNANDFTNIEFLPYDASIYDYSEKPFVFNQNGIYTLNLRLDKNRYEEPEKLRGILIGRKGQFGNSQSSAIEVDCEFNK